MSNVRSTDNFSFLTSHFPFRSCASAVVPGRLELPTSTLSVWRSNQLSYRTLFGQRGCLCPASYILYSIINISSKKLWVNHKPCLLLILNSHLLIGSETIVELQKGGVPAAPSGTATLLRLSPNHRFHPRPTLAVTDFRRPRLSWLDGRCVQGPGTYSPRHG